MASAPPARIATSNARRALAKRLADGEPVLFYDGVCALCNGFVKFVLRYDRHGSLKFATLQGELGDAAREMAPQLAGIDSLILITPSGAYVRSAGALEILRYLGGLWSLGLALYILPRALRDWAYDAIAARRYRTFGKYDACPIPEPSVRARFLD